MNSTPTGFAEYTQFSHKLAQVDLGPVAQRLSQTEGWSDQQIEQAMVRYRQFLFLFQQYPDQEFVPDRETDSVLHAHLETDQYVRDCQILFGADLLHENGFGTRGEVDRCSWLERFNYTKALIQQHFNWASLNALKPANCVVQLAV
jgi:hypothetical protein|nr:MAG: hypothetical protein EDM05_29610 [Leptolyngbya sp. IPPAS B-1204]